MINAAELVKLQWRPHGWLLWQMVPQGGITLLAGETASGKSLLGLDLALGLAAGRGRAWDMEIADSSWLLADREKINDGEKTADSSWLIADREKIAANRPCTERTPAVPHGEDRETSPAACPGSEAERVPHGADSVQNDAHLIHRSAVPLPQGGRHKEIELTPAACPGSEAERVPEEAVRVQNDAHLMRNGTSHIPYREKIADSSWLIADKEKINDMEKTDFPITYQLSPMSCLPRVRYFCGDADPNLIAERVLRLCRGYPNGKKGMGIDVPDALDLDFTAHQFSDPQSFAWLAKEVVRQGYQLLIFDGLAQYLPGMADGSAPTVGAFLRGVRQLASQTGVSVLLIHQFNKRQAARLDKWGLPTSQGEERIRGSSELLAGVDSVLLLSRPDAIALGAKGRALLKVVKNRLGQAGARLQFTIVDGDQSLHLLFERLARQAQPKPRRLVDAALDEMMRILMEQDQREFDRAELTKILQQRMNLPSTRSLTEAFRILGKEPRVRVERDETGKKRYAWANPGTGAMENIMYGLPPVMAIDLASSYLLNKARLNLADQQLEKMQNQAKPSELEQRLADFLNKAEGEGKEG